jgi:hypothetical protein
MNGLLDTGEMRFVIVVSLTKTQLGTTRRISLIHKVSLPTAYHVVAL